MKMISLLEAAASLAFAHGATASMEEDVSRRPRVKTTGLTRKTAPMWVEDAEEEGRSLFTKSDRDRIHEQELLSTPQQTWYYTTLEFGSERQPIEVLIDSGSSWTWVSAVNCNEEQCEGEYSYQHPSSKSFTKTFDQHKIVYGSLTAIGYISYDDVWADNRGTSVPGEARNMKAEELPFLIVPEQDDNIKAILGLSPNDDSSGPLFVDYLYRQNQIDYNRFSIQMAPLLPDLTKIPDQTITWGGLASGISDDFVFKNYKSHRVTGSYHWQIKMNGLKYKGKVANKNATGESDRYTYQEEVTARANVPLGIIDTGATLCVFQAEIYWPLMEALCKDIECIRADRPKMWRIPNCSPEWALDYFEPIYVQLDNLWYSIPPNSYLFFGTDSCWIKFHVRQPEKPTALFGITFLENYDQFYDLEANQVAFMPNAFTTATVTPVDAYWATKRISTKNLHVVQVVLCLILQLTLSGVALRRKEYQVGVKPLHRRQESDKSPGGDIEINQLAAKPSAVAQPDPLQSQAEKQEPDAPEESKVRDVESQDSQDDHAKAINGEQPPESSANPKEGENLVMMGEILSSRVSDRVPPNEEAHAQASQRPIADGSGKEMGESDADPVASEDKIAITEMQLMDELASLDSIGEDKHYLPDLMTSKSIKKLSLPSQLLP